jgi:hypothetical protein
MKIKKFFQKILNIFKESSEDKANEILNDPVIMQKIKEKVQLEIWKNQKKERGYVG